LLVLVNGCGPACSWEGPLRWHVVLWIAVLGFLAAWAPMTLDWPFFRDHGVMAWAGHVVREGGLPYRDAWDVKGPLLYYAFAAVELVAGTSQWGVRAADLLITVTTAALLALAGYRLAGVLASGYGAVIFLVHHFGLDYRATAQPDGWGSLPIAGALLCLTSPGGLSGLGRIAVAAALVSGAALLKPTFALYLLAPLAVISAHRTGEWPARIAAATGGFLLLPALTVGWFVLRGAFSELMDVQLTFNLGAYAELGRASPSRHIMKVLEFLQRPGEALAVCLAAAGAWHMLRTQRQAGMLLVAAVITGVLSVAVQQKYFTYHWQATFVPLSLLAGIGIAYLWPREPVLAGITALLLIAMQLQEPWWRLREWRERGEGFEEQRDYEARFEEYGDSTFRRDTNSLVDWLRSHAAPGEQLQVWGHQPGVNFRTGLDSPGRFGYVLPLVVNKDTPLRQRYRSEFLARIRSDPPHWVVVVVHDAHGTLLGKSSGQLLAGFPEFAGILARNYELDTVVGPYEVRTRRDRLGIKLGVHSQPGARCAPF
jgi:hypothetical protein